MRFLKLGVGSLPFLILAVLAIGAAQAPEAVITIEAWSPQEIHDLGWTSHPSSGLSVVGVEELVYFFVEDGSGEQVTTVTWTLTSQPAASAATLDSTDTQRTTFSPDVEGQYVVEAEITTASGVAAASITITAAKYVGVGIWTELVANPGSGECAPCHTDKIEQWVETEHPTLFKDGIEGIASDHYAEHCIECHTVGYFEDAANGGFWDVQQQVGWEFPDTLEAGNWDDLVTNFPALAKLASIQCENCHGPASQHKQTFDKELMAVTLEEGACGRCHEEEPYHRINIQWKLSGHSAGDVAFGANREDCAPCHSGRGFVNKVDPDVPFEEGLGFPLISCAVCHDPHDAGLPHQIRNVDNVTLMNGESFTFGGNGRLCMNCHLSRRDAEEYVQEYHSHFGPHHSNQADVLAGANAITFGMHIPSSTHKDVVPNACVGCHMAPTPGNPRAPLPETDHIGGHSFALHWDAGTPDDPSDDVDHVAACQSCHGDIASFEDIRAKEDYDGNGVIESARAEIVGLLHEVGRLLPPLGEPEVNVTQEDYDPAAPGLTPDEVAKRQLYLKAAYNYLVVEEDGSHGFHNYQFAVNLLRVTHQALTTGSVGAGSILAINDVPNDQGKQVRVAWSRFGGDGVGDNPVGTYALWRRVDDAQSAAKQDQAQSALKAADLSLQAVETLEAGDRVEFGAELWDYVASVPAAQLEEYSTVVPTLFDSTAADGVQWSVFMVSGHTGIPAMFAISSPDSGYSIDNLAPTAPTNFAGQETLAGLELKWQESLDADFDYFALYRSTTPGFDPSGTEPIATLTETQYVDGEVDVGETYYYRLSAFDFAGNESAFTDELSLNVTSVASNPTAMIPDDYVLEQNYPNPFNPTTTITFGLKETGHVNLTIYNALGEEVMRVVDGHMEAGYHRITISAQNLPTGLYFYRVAVNGFKSVRKMVVTK